MKVIGQKLKNFVKNACAVNKRRVVFAAKIATIHGEFILFTFLDNFWYQCYQNRKKVLCSRLALITLTRKDYQLLINNYQVARN